MEQFLSLNFSYTLQVLNKHYMIIIMDAEDVKFGL